MMPYNDDSSAWTPVMVTSNYEQAIILTVNTLTHPTMRITADQEQLPLHDTMYYVYILTYKNLPLKK